MKMRGVSVHKYLKTLKFGGFTSNASKRLIFLDRDGVINKYPGDRKYVRRLSEFRFLPGAKRAIARLAKEGFKLFIISNQAGVSKGIYSKAALDKITAYMLKKIESAGGRIDGVYYCLHQESDSCLCRKPRTGLIDRALRENQLKKTVLKKAFFIGDSIRDIITAHSAGVKSILVFSGKEKSKNRAVWQIQPEFTAKDLLSAAERIISGKIK